MTVRAYLPVRADQVRALADAGTLRHPGPVYAVTDAVRRADPEGGEEDWEEAARDAAAEAALAAGGPVAVLAADLAAPAVPGSAGAGEGAALTWAGTVARADVASVHLGGDALAAPGSVAGEDALELSWYDVSELADVARILEAHART